MQTTSPSFSIQPAHKDTRIYAPMGSGWFWPPSTSVHPSTTRSVAFDRGLQRAHAAPRLALQRRRLRQQQLQGGHVTGEGRGDERCGLGGC